MAAGCFAWPRDRLPWLRHTSQGGRDTPRPCPPPDSPLPAPRPARIAALTSQPLHNREERETNYGENHKGILKVLALSLFHEAQHSIMAFGEEQGGSGASVKNRLPLNLVTPLNLLYK